MDYKSIKICECNLNYTCNIHPPDYNYSFLGLTTDDILKKENISKEELYQILKLKTKILK